MIAGASQGSGDFALWGGRGSCRGMLWRPRVGMPAGDEGAKSGYSRKSGWRSTRLIPCHSPYRRAAAPSRPRRAPWSRISPARTVTSV
jgi:hypothetical protein